MHGVAGGPVLQVVADYTRLSAVQSAGAAGHRQAPRLKYPGMATRSSDRAFRSGQVAL
jgi:hypothetical protein